MTEKELVDLGKNKVRHNKQLLALFKGFFRESFGREAKCPSCGNGFSDFDFLREKYYPTKNRAAMKLTKYRVLYPRETILAYLKSGRVYRSRVTGISDQFAADFLRHANPKVYPNFNKMVLPLIEEEPIAEKIISQRTEKEVFTEEKEVSPTPKKRRSPKKKKDE